MHTNELRLDTSDGPMRAYQASPPIDALGAVIVIAEAFGVNEHIEDVTRRVADAGYLGLAIDIFHRSGGGTAQYDDFRGAMGLFKGLTDDGLLVDIDAAREHLQGIGFAPSATGIIGFCFGGRVAFLAAARRSFGAAVSFYPGGMISTGVIRGFDALLDDVPALETPWLGLFGDHDQSIPTTDVEQLRVVLDDQARVAHDIVRYADADHAFHCDARPSYHEPSAIDAWQRATGWFADHLG